MTQASRLVDYIRQHRAMHQRWPTYQQLLLSCISVCPWKRLEEGAHRWLRPGESIERETNAQGLVTFKIVRKK